MKCIFMYMCTPDFYSIQLFVECYPVIKPLWLQYYVYVSPYPVENYPTWFEKNSDSCIRFSSLQKLNLKVKMKSISPKVRSLHEHSMFTNSELMQPFKNYARLYKKMIVLLFGLMKRD